MTGLAIQADGLGKRYRLGEQGVRDAARGAPPARAADGAQSERLRATSGRLRDVDLEIDEGDIVGIIGRNGAGKTTFLKTVARIVRPTTGVVRVRGRVGALLEVGTGFHPELTGRENVYLNGVVLGMSRREIRRRFDDIVEFAGVERFLDTPLKRYSSGMYLRLAFAVAAHIEPDVADRRRGARRRRRRVPAPLPRAHVGVRPGGSNRALREPRHGRGRSALPARDLARRAAGCVTTGRRTPSSTAISATSPAERERSDRDRRRRSDRQRLVAVTDKHGNEQARSGETSHSRCVRFPCGNA